MDSENEDNYSSQLTPTLHGGSLFGKIGFSHDSRYIFCCCGSVLKVYNTTNGEQIHDLRWHTGNITGVHVNPNNVLQVLTCGEDGLLIHWDYLDGSKLKEQDFRMPLHGIVSINGKKKSIMMIAQTSSSGENKFSLMQWWSNKKNVHEFCKSKVLMNCSSDQGTVSFGCMREFAAAAIESDLSVYSMKNETVKVVQNKVWKGRTINCVACHPSEYCIATGHESGRINLWYNFFKEGQPLVTHIHWHALPVLCLNFTPDGSVLLSGGHECVFVRWQMNNTTQKDFKPRMGAPLTQVLCSPDGNFYATAHSDNVVQLMDIDLKIHQVFTGLLRGNLGQDDGKPQIPAGLLYDPRSKVLVTNGRPGHLQFYSLTLQKQLYNLDIVGQNYITTDSLDRTTTTTEVVCCAISMDGQWLATFEIWDDGTFTPELCLKFWQYSSDAYTYTLNTIVECPHEHKITSMAFRPPLSSGADERPPCLVTLGTDKCFKLWELVDDTNIYRQNAKWTCESIGFYHSLETSCADFSMDGSTLAVAFEHLTTLWDPDNNVVRNTLSNSLPHKERVRHVKFGNSKCWNNLVITTENHLIVWDLLAVTIQWKIVVSAKVLLRDPSSTLMAFVSTDGALSVFSPKCSDMIYHHENVSQSSIVDAIFIPNDRHPDIVDVGWPGSSQIYMFNVDHHLLTLDLPRSQMKSNRVRIAQNLPQSGFRAIMAEKVVRENEDSDKKETIGATQSVDDGFISTMLHTNESITLYCQQFLEKLIIKKKKKHKTVVVESEEEDESDDAKSSGSESESEIMDTSGSKTINAQVAVQGSDVNYVTPLGDGEDDLDKILLRRTDWQWVSKLQCGQE